MAPPGLSGILVPEITTAWQGSAANSARYQELDPAHQPRQRFVGRAAGSWRTAQTGYRDQPGGRFEVHDAPPQAFIPNLADVPAEPFGLSGIDRFLRRANRYLPPLVRVHRPTASAPPDLALRRYHVPNHGMDLATDPRGVSM